jgi:hypothetical protein
MNVSRKGVFNLNRPRFAGDGVLVSRFPARTHAVLAEDEHDAIRTAPTVTLSTIGTVHQVSTGLLRVTARIARSHAQAVGVSRE